MPELLTRGELCGLGLEDCPNGRLQIGTLSGFISERRPASRRNTRPDKIGIYMLSPLSCRASIATRRKRSCTGSSAAAWLP